MAGTAEGGRKAAKTNLERFGKDFYKIIGAKGGRNGHTGGFCNMTHEQRVACGRKGGAKSTRTGIKNGQGKKATRDIDAIEKTIKEIEWTK